MLIKRALVISLWLNSWLETPISDKKKRYIFNKPNWYFKQLKQFCETILTLKLENLPGLNLYSTYPFLINCKLALKKTEKQQYVIFQIYFLFTYVCVFFSPYWIVIFNSAFIIFFGYTFWNVGQTLAQESSLSFLKLPTGRKCWTKYRI